MFATPRFAGDASKPDSITVELSSTRAKFQKTVEVQLRWSLRSSCPWTIFCNIVVVELRSTVMESGLDASSAERGVSSTMSSSGVFAHVGVVAFGESFPLTPLRLRRGC